jgi:hypothetical protein
VDGCNEVPFGSYGFESPQAEPSEPACFLDLAKV